VCDFCVLCVLTASSSSSSPIPQQPDQEMHSLNANTPTTTTTNEIEPSYENTSAILSTIHKSNENNEKTDSLSKNATISTTVSTTSVPLQTQNNTNAKTTIENNNDSIVSDIGKENGNVTNRTSINNNNNHNNNKMEELYDIPVGMCYRFFFFNVFLDILWFFFRLCSLNV
jgi:ATP-dependent Zn protease